LCGKVGADSNDGVHRTLSHDATDITVNAVVGDRDTP
jgi:hypothetical protein